MDVHGITKGVYSRGFTIVVGCPWRSVLTIWNFATFNCFSEHCNGRCLRDGESCKNSLRRDPACRWRGKNANGLGLMHPAAGDTYGVCNRIIARFCIVFIVGVGFVCCWFKSKAMRRPQIVERQQAGSTFFLCACVSAWILTTIRDIERRGVKATII